MKGLLIKDLCIISRQMRFFLLLLVVYCVYPSQGLNAFAMLFTVSLPMGLISYDEKSKWDRLAAMLPYSPRSLVFSKYVMGYLTMGVTVLLSVAAQIVTATVTHQPLDHESILFTLMMAGAVMIVMALMLPLLFRFGSEKGRLLSMVVVICSGTIGYQMANGGLEQSLRFLARIPVPGLLLTAAVVAVNAVSVELSVRFYRKRAF